MNANLLIDLVAIREKIDSLDGEIASDTASDTTSYEIALAKTHVNRAIEWETNRS